MKTRLKITTQPNGYKLADVNTFHNGAVHSIKGPLATNTKLKNEQDLVRYAKENNLTISFGRQ